MEGELTDHDDFSSDVLDAQVHFSLGILENPELGNFSAKPIDVRDIVRFLNPKQDQQAVPDQSDVFAIDADAGGGNALEKGSHVGGDIRL